MPDRDGVPDAELPLVVGPEHEELPAGDEGGVLLAEGDKRDGLEIGRIAGHGPKANAGGAGAGAIQ